MNPELMNTDREKLISAPQNSVGQTVFMGSGFGPMGHPGMTRVISGQLSG